jgi:hypothetical protein
MLQRRKDMCILDFFSATDRSTAIVRICCYPNPCRDYNPDVRLIARIFLYPSESSFQDEFDGTPSIA